MRALQLTLRRPPARMPSFNGDRLPPGLFCDPLPRRSPWTLPSCEISGACERPRPAGTRSLIPAGATDLSTPSRCGAFLSFPARESHAKWGAA